MNAESGVVIILMCLQAYSLSMIYWIRDDYKRLKEENQRLNKRIDQFFDWNIKK